MIFLLNGFKQGGKISFGIIHIFITSLVPEVATVEGKSDFPTFTPKQATSDTISEWESVVPALDRGGQCKVIFP